MMMDFMFSAVFVIGMTTLMLPTYDAALSMSLLQLLLRIEPCVMAFTNPTAPRRAAPKASVPSPLRSVDEGSSGSRPEATEGGGDDRPSFKKEGGRKLVDRSSVYVHHSSPAARASTDAARDVSAAAAPPRLDDEDIELCYLDDMPGTNAGETCFVSHSSSISSDPESSRFLASLPFNTRIPPVQALDLALRFIPVVMPVLAYWTYEPTAKVFERTVEYISNNNWVAVDGGQYQANIITPAINGLVVPSMALLFATMTSNTINTLRQRQLQIRTSLNTEANDLRMVSTMVDSLPPELRDFKNHLREYLIQYASR